MKRPLITRRFAPPGACAAAVVVVAAPAVAAPAPHPDAGLLAACAAHMNLAAEEERLLHAMRLHPIDSRTPEAIAAEAAWDAAGNRAADALALVMGMQAVTLEGAAAKGRSVLTYRRTLINPGETDADLDFHERGALSVLRDLERLAGGAA